MSKKVRCFVAIDLSKEAVDEIIKIQELLVAENLFSGKITKPENLHLTLKFLGEIDNEQLELVKQKLKEIKFNPFTCSLGQAGVFDPKHIKIIWLTLIGDGVNFLQQKVDEALKDIFIPEKRFMSHITIARVKSVENNNRLINFLNEIDYNRIQFLVDRFILKESKLKPEGPVYNDIEQFRSYA